MTRRSASPLPLRLLLLAPAGLLAGCWEAAVPRDVMGNFDVAYADNLRVYIGDALVGEVTPGSEETLTWDGGTFTAAQVCGEDGTDCPSEGFWRTAAVDQPWGSGYELLNFVNLDLERGEAGQRMGGLVDAAGAFEMLAGLGVAADNGCAVLGVGTVTGAFSGDAAAINAGIVTYEWSGGCQIGEVTIGSSLRLETDFTATRTGDYDVSSVTPEAPIDEEGEVVDPEVPEGAAPVG